jgi:hypothetical protein
MYQPLTINQHTPAGVRRLIQHLDMLLGDVHAMLRLPRQEDGLTHGCNFAAATVLLEIIGGVSSTLFQHDGRSGDKYKTLLRTYYPWAAQGCCDPASASKLLYKFFRNPLAHELGIRRKKGGIGKSNGLPEDLIEKLELSPTPPLNPPIQSDATEEVLTLEVDALYWGTRIMIQNLTEDAPMMKKAEAYLRKQLNRKNSSASC